MSILPLLSVFIYVYVYVSIYIYNNVMFVTEQTSVLYIFMNSSSIITVKYINVIFPDMYYLENKHWLNKCDRTSCV